MKFFYRHRGSVSIFLAIILLPMMTLSGLLVDAANLNMSKAVVESAGEMAAQSALATYDTVLEDVYGLFAMSQSNEELQENVAQYFEDTLSAAGLLDSSADYQSQLLTQAQGYVNEIMNTVTAEDVSDNFLNVSVDNVKVTQVAGSELSNPAILKNQIVEFMKYRGVAEVGMDLLGTLNAFKSINDKSKVADKKAEVDKAISNLGDASSAFYEALVTLDKEIAKIQKELKELDWATAEKKMKSAHETIITYLIDAAEIKLDHKMTHSSADSFAIANPGKTSDVALEDAIASLNTELTTVFGADPDEISGISGIEMMQTYLDVEEKAVNIESAFDALNNYMPKLCSVFVCWQNMNMASDPERGEDEAESDYNKRIEELHASRDAAESDALDKFGKVWPIIDAYQTFYDTYQTRLENARKSAGKDLTAAYNELKPLYDAINALLEKEVDTKWYKFWDHTNFIDDVVKLGEKVISDISGVKTANKNLNTQVETYAKNQSKDEYYEIMSSETSKNSSTFNTKDVQEVIDQVKAIKSFLADSDGLKSRLSGTVYGKTFLDVATKSWKTDNAKCGKHYGDAAKKLLKGDSFSVSKSDSYYKSHVKVNLQEKKMTSSVYLKQIAERFTIDDVTIGVPSFYLYLISTYGGKGNEEDDTDSNLTGSAKDLNKDGKDAANESADLKYDASIFDTLESTTKATKKNSIGSVDDEDQTGIIKQMQSMISLVQGLLGVLDNGLEGARDNLFVTEYIYENFSNYSFCMEKSEEYDKEHFTMTNVAISTANNPLYGCEVEYILYGQKGIPAKVQENFPVPNVDAGPQENIKLVKGNIFAIRFVCNTIYALTAGDIDAQTLPPALAIQAATLGVFPYQVAQVVFKLCLAMAETVYDLNEIMKGEKVALIKNSQTWTFSVNGMINAVKEEAVDAVAEGATDIAKRAIDTLSGKMQEFVNSTVDMAASEVTALAEDITSGVTSSLKGMLNDAISAMAQTLTDEVEKIYAEIFTAAGSLKLDEAAIKERLTSALNTYLDNAKGTGAYSDEVITFLQGQMPTIVDKVMTAKPKAGGKSLSEYLAMYNSQLQKVMDGTKDSIEVTSKDFTNLLNCVTNGITVYLDEAADTITGTVKTWVTGLSDEISGEINGFIEKQEEELKNASGQAIENVKAKVNETLESYFPDAAGDISVDGKSADSSGMASMFTFGYQDYLRLFLFLELSGKNSNNVVKRIGDVITINIKTDGGLSAYYASAGIDGHPAKSTFSMSKAYTYVSISADVEIKPLLLSQELFTKGADIDPSDSLWSYTYGTIAGY
ncbi:MAG: hypothetical protein IJZ85_12365 [Lachnospiraceae bacterium]|nr:hypothetical protein [Lachnospiraceae bacterium]